MAQMLPIFQVDAFTDHLFGGNPAAVVPLDQWLDSAIMQNIAAENNLAETAFFVRAGNTFNLRWFTPALEVDLCGHATIAAAHVLYQHLDYTADTISFQTRSGVLTVKKNDGLLSLDMPAGRPSESSVGKSDIDASLQATSLEVWEGIYYLARFGTEAEVNALDPDFALMKTFEKIGVVATAPGDKVDFVSRFFAPKAGIPEDPVTGSAHSMLVPFWADLLEKNEMEARQISPRVGDLHCRFDPETMRVELQGKAVTYLQGYIHVN